MKPTVHLREMAAPNPQVGSRVYIKTINHPSPNVTNWPHGEGWVLTSRIVSVRDSEDPYSGFETENTHYQPHPELFRNG